MSATINHSVSTRFDADTLVRLDAISQKQQRSRSDIIKEAVGGYLDSLVWFEAEVKKGLDDLDQGQVIGHDDLKDELRKLGVKC